MCFPVVTGTLLNTLVDQRPREARNSTWGHQANSNRDADGAIECALRSNARHPQKARVSFLRKSSVSQEVPHALQAVAAGIPKRAVMDADDRMLIRVDIERLVSGADMGLVEQNLQ
jgi:hypothetical protein